MLLAFHKPYGVLSQFTPDQPGQRTLAEFGFPVGVYPIGRLDQDSEGFLILGDEKSIVAPLLEPVYGHQRTYHVQVEGIPSPEALQLMRSGGIDLKGHRTLPCQVQWLDPQPEYPPRDPPVRFRKSVPDGWMAITLIEGKNRQVRRMTAAVGHPTLRLIRVMMGRLELGNLPVGEWYELTAAQRELLFATTKRHQEKSRNKPPYRRS